MSSMSGGNKRHDDPGFKMVVHNVDMLCWILKTCVDPYKDCTLDEIKAAYGEPTEDPYRSDSLGYWDYAYEDDDYDFKARFTVYDDKGLTRIELESYKTD